MAAEAQEQDTEQEQDTQESADEREFVLDEHVDEEGEPQQQLRQRIREAVENGYLNDETLERFDEVEDLLKQKEPLSPEEREELQQKVEDLDTSVSGGALLGVISTYLGGVAGFVAGTSVGGVGAVPGAMAGAAIAGGGGSTLAGWGLYEERKKRKNLEHTLQQDELLDEYRVVDREQAEDILSTLPDDIDMVRIPTDHWPGDTEDRERAIKDLGIIAPEDEEARYLLKMERVTQDDAEFPDYLRKHDELYRFTLEVYTDHVDEDGEQLHHPERWVFTGYHEDLSHLTDKGSAKERMDDLKRFFGADEEEPDTLWAPQGTNTYLQENLYDGEEDTDADRTMLLDPVDTDNAEVQQEVQGLQETYEHWLYKEPSYETAENLVRNTQYTAKGLYRFIQETDLDPETDQDFINALIRNVPDHIIRLPETDRTLYNVGERLPEDKTLIVEDPETYEDPGKKGYGDVVFMEQPDDTPKTYGAVYTPKDDEQPSEYGEPIELEQTASESKFRKYVARLRE